MSVIQKQLSAIYVQNNLKLPKHLYNCPCEKYKNTNMSVYKRQYKE